MYLLVCDGFYWWDVKSYWKNAQNWKNLMVYNDILMETIGISVMVSIRLL